MTLRKKFLLELILFSFGVIVLASSGLGTVEAIEKCCHYEEEPPTNLRSNIDYGYVTVVFEEIPDGTDSYQDARSWYKWPEGSSLFYLVNTAGLIGVTSNDALQIIENSEDEWYKRLEDSSSIPSLAFGGTTTNVPSWFETECGTGSSTGNELNEIGFCDISSSGLTRKSTTQLSANYYHISETDIILDTKFLGNPWTDSELFFIMQHEFGHFYGLGDLYNFHPGPDTSCTNGENPQPIMCRQATIGNIQNGDRDGIKFLYPKEHSFALQQAGIISGTDSAVGLISPITGCIPSSSGDWTLNSSCTLAGSATAPGNVIVQGGATLTVPDTKTLAMDFDNHHLLIENNGGVLIKSGGKVSSSEVGFEADPDLLFVWGDFSDNTTTIKVTPIWDLNRTSGKGTVGFTSTLFTVPGQVNDVGATLANVDGDSNQDLIISYTLPNITPYAFYTIYFDLTRSSGDGISHTGSTGSIEVGNNITFNEKGTDVVVFDIDNNGSQDLVVSDSFLSGSTYQLWQHYGPLSTSGFVSTWNTNNYSGFSMTSEDLGFTIVDSDKRIATLTYGNTITSQLEYARDHVFYIANDASLTDNILGKHSPLKRIPLSPNGIGSGDSIDIGELAYNDKITSWADLTKGYYTIDWDTRLYSHG